MIVLEMVDSQMNGQSQVLVMRPRSLEEAQRCVVEVRAGNTVVLSLSESGSSPEEDQRIVDFVSGGVHALDGKRARAGENVFVFGPVLTQLEFVSMAYKAAA